MGTGNKKDKKCYTCQYWTGDVEVTSPNFVKYQNGAATCNKTGHIRPAWTSCNKHQKRIDI